MVNLFLSGSLQDVYATMESFESLFMRSYVKEDGSRPSLNPQTTLLHTNALLSWALLLTICTGSQVKAVTHKYVLNSNLLSPSGTRLSVHFSL
jgi:hypothetical protein